MDDLSTITVDDHDDHAPEAAAAILQEFLRRPKNFGILPPILEARAARNEPRNAVLGGILYT